MQFFSFVMKHINGSVKKFNSGLSNICMVLEELHVNTLGYEHLQELYRGDRNFKEVYEICINPMTKDRS